MKFFLCILLPLLTFSAFGQINILIIDETKSSFWVGIDGYVQNEDPTNKIFIKNLDTSDHRLIFKFQDKDETTINRKLVLPQTGTYKFVIQKNFKGQTQLRYRGFGSHLATNEKSVSFKEDVFWILKHPNPNINPFPKIDTNTTLVILDTVIDISPPLDSIPKTTIADALNSKDTLKGTNDTAIINTVVNAHIDSVPATIAKTVVPDTLESNSLNRLKPDTSTSVKVVVDTALIARMDTAFFQLLKEMSAAEFEFNKLNLAKTYLINHALSVEELEEIFKHFSYDNTKLQYLNYAIERLKDKENILLLLPSFDYELSKDQFKSLYLNE